MTTNLNMMPNNYEVVQNTMKLAKILFISSTFPSVNFLTKCVFSLELCRVPLLQQFKRPLERTVSLRKVLGLQ